MKSGFLKKVKKLVSSGSGKQLAGSIALCALALFLAIDGSVGWYRVNKMVDALRSSLNSQKSTMTMDEGYDSYKWEYDEEKGILVDGITVMNNYDRVFSNTNQRTPIVLRAILSPEWANKAENNVVKLVLKCETESGFQSKHQGETVFPLSDVVNFRVAYLPGVAAAAVNGDYNGNATWNLSDSSNVSAPYVDGDDFIYRYATDRIEQLYGNTAYKFVNYESWTDPAKTEEGEHTVTYNVTKVTSTDHIKDAPTSSHNTVENPDKTKTTTNTEYSVYYLINNGNNFLSYSGGALKDATGSVELGTGLASPGEISESMKWNITSGYKLENSGKYLTGGRSGNFWNYSYNVSMTDAGSNWTFTYDRNSTNPTLSSNNTYLSRDWTGARNGTNNTMEVYRVEKKDEWESVYTPPVDINTYTKKATIDVNLTEARDDDGYYYVYIMMDYDEELVRLYLQTHTSITWKIGSEEDQNVQFVEDFHITAIEPS